MGEKWLGKKTESKKFLPYPNSVQVLGMEQPRLHGAPHSGPNRFPVACVVNQFIHFLWEIFNPAETLPAGIWSSRKSLAPELQGEMSGYSNWPCKTLHTLYSSL